MSISLKFLDNVGPREVTDKAMEKVVTTSEDALQRAAAVEFASGLVDHPMGASAAAIVNHAIATFFVHGRNVEPKHLKAIGKGLKSLTKMGIPWNAELVPLPFLDVMGLPKPKMVEHRLHVVSDLLTQVCEARAPKKHVALRAEVWNGRSGRLKLVLNGHQEVGYCHRPGPKGTWTVYQDIGENSKKLADGVETKELLKTVKALFGGDEPEKVVVEGPVGDAVQKVVGAVTGAEPAPQMTFASVRAKGKVGALTPGESYAVRWNRLRRKYDIGPLTYHQGDVFTPVLQMSHADFWGAVEAGKSGDGLTINYPKLRPRIHQQNRSATSAAHTAPIKQADTQNLTGTDPLQNLLKMSEGPVGNAVKAAANTAVNMAKDAGTMAFNRFADRAAQRSAVARTAVDAARGTLTSAPMQVRSKAPVNGLRPGSVYTVKPSEKQAPGRKSYDFVDDKGHYAATMDDKEFQQRMKDKGFETVGNTTPKVV